MWSAKNDKSLRLKIILFLSANLLNIDARDSPYKKFVGSQKKSGVPKFSSVEHSNEFDFVKTLLLFAN